MGWSGGTGLRGKRAGVEIWAEVEMSLSIRLHTLLWYILSKILNEP